MGQELVRSHGWDVSGQEIFKSHESGRVWPRVCFISRVRWGQEVMKSSWVGSSREIFEHHGLGRVGRFSNITGSVGSGSSQSSACRVGSGRDISKCSRVGSGQGSGQQDISNCSRVESGQPKPVPSRPDRTQPDATREKAREIIACCGSNLGLP